MTFRDHPDIAFFQRGRKCVTCEHHFVTTEVEIEFLEELMELRLALGDLKQNATLYARQSKEASKSLRELNRSLQQLRTLDIYNEANG